MYSFIFAVYSVESLLFIGPIGSIVQSLKKIENIFYSWDIIQKQCECTLDFNKQ